jgi:hypothetical protein
MAGSSFLWLGIALQTLSRSGPASSFVSCVLSTWQSVFCVCQVSHIGILATCQRVSGPFYNPGPSIRISLPAAHFLFLAVLPSFYDPFLCNVWGSKLADEEATHHTLAACVPAAQWPIWSPILSTALNMEWFEELRASSTLCSVSTLW